jgi:hypothetical protein
VEVFAGTAQVRAALAEAFGGTLAFQGGVDALVVVFFQPAVEEFVELVEGACGLEGQALLEVGLDGFEEALDLSFGISRGLHPVRIVQNNILPSPTRFIRGAGGGLNESICADVGGSGGSITSRIPAARLICQRLGRTPGRGTRSSNRRMGGPLAEPWICCDWLI